MAGPGGQRWQWGRTRRALWAQRVAGLLAGCVEVVACPVAAMCIFLHCSAFWAALWVLIGCGMPNAKNAKSQIPNPKKVPKFRGPTAVSRYHLFLTRTL